METKMENLINMSKDQLVEMNVKKQLHPLAKNLGIKNLKKFNKSTLIDEIIKVQSQQQVSEVDEIQSEDLEAAAEKFGEITSKDKSEQVEKEFDEQFSTENQEDKSTVRPQPTFASTVEKNGKKFYQYYPVKNSYKKKVSLFRVPIIKKGEVKRGSVCWIEDPEGNKIYEGKSWDTAYKEAINFRNQQFQDSTVVVYFDFRIPVPGSYGKTY